MARLCEGGRGRKYRLTCFAARPSPSGVVAHGWLKRRNQRRRPANWAESQEWGVGRTLPRVGDHVVENTPIAWWWPDEPAHAGARVTERLGEHLIAAILVGGERTGLRR
jgi:hypothetical protein